MINTTNVYISPVFGEVDMNDIVEFMKDNKMNGVTLQIQLHKIIWDPNKEGCIVNMKKIDTKEIEEHIRGILIALGDNPDREGLKDTPKRVAKMYEEVFDGMCYTNDEIADMFNTTFEDDLCVSENS